GQLFASTPLESVVSILNISDVYVGWWKNTPTANPAEYFAGEIAHLRFWNKALSQEEIQEDMISHVTIGTAGLIAAYDLSNILGTGTDLSVPDITGKHPALLHGYSRP